MKRLFLGIVFVFCIELGFVAYTAIDQQSQQSVGVSEITGVTTPPADLTSTADPVGSLQRDSVRGSERNQKKEVAYSNVDRHLLNRRADRSLISRKIVARSSTAKVVNVRPQSFALQKQSETTLTTANPSPLPLNRESKNFKTMARDVSRSKNKSFLSKTVSVVKKPYDWLKAIGSRLR